MQIRASPPSWHREEGLKGRAGRGFGRGGGGLNVRYVTLHALEQNHQRLPPPTVPCLPLGSPLRFSRLLLTASREVDATAC